MRQVLGPGALGRPRGIRVEREVGGGIEMGNTCKPMADSFQCMTKPTTKKKKTKNRGTVEKLELCTLLVGM